MKLERRLLIALFVLTIGHPGLLLAQTRSNLSGSIKDEFGAAIVGATVTLTRPNEQDRSTTTSVDGTYSFANLPAGKYRLRVSAKGFATSAEVEIDLAGSKRKVLDLTLKVATIQSDVEVDVNRPSLDPSTASGQTVITDRDLNLLPNDPDELAAALQALAGTSNGPDGGEILIDGFSNGSMPSRNSIREIRISSNMLAAENDAPVGRIEILTRAGSDKFHGGAEFNFTDESLNSRNPFQTSSAKRAPFQVRQFGANVNGPLHKKQSSFYLELTRNNYDDNELIHATVLDSSLNPVLVGQLAFTPRKFVGVDQRVDYTINPRNSLVERYTYRRNLNPSAGIGGFSLRDRSFRQLFVSHSLQLSDTAVLNTKAVNETRFQYLTYEIQNSAASAHSTLNVSGSFVGGGASIGHGHNRTNRWELQNNTEIQTGKHTIKFGARFRRSSITDINQGNFNGQWTFTGGITGLTSLERYRRTLQLQQLNLTPEQIRTAGGGAAQFSIAIGNPLATFKQFDLEPFAQDDWRVRPNLILSYGLRYEVQSNADSRLGFAPRLAMAWSPGKVKNGHSPKTVIRGGAGIFYNRFGENSSLFAEHFDGTNIQQFSFSESTNPSVPADPFTLNILNSFHCVDGSTTPNCVTSLPSIAGAKPVTQTIWRVATDLRVPAIYFAGGQVERQLPHNFVVTFSANVRRVVHAIVLRDVNAPIPGTITALNPGGIRPDPGLGEINEYEGIGRFRIKQMSVAVRSRLNSRFSFNSNYSVGRVVSDGDGQNGGEIAGIPALPNNSYDVRGEWGPASYDIQQTFSLFGTYTNPRLWKISFAPYILARSAPPFNITTGIDSNLDHQFTDRPSFAGPNANCSLPFIKCTRFGNFNLLPAPGEQVIPRNFGRGTASVTLNLRLSRAFGFGGSEKKPASASDQKYKITLSIEFQNLLNTVNQSTPIGNLSSPLFGQAQGIVSLGAGGGGANAANRRIYLNLQFAF